jgi:hypothetical protein
MALYNSFKRDIQNGSINLSTDTVKVMLLTSSYTPNIDTHAKRSDVEANEVTGTGYTSGGTALASKAVSVDTTNDRGVFDADDVTWATSTITARYAVIYKSRGGASTADELVGVVDFGSDKSSSAGNFVIQWNTNGILYLS